MWIEIGVNIISITQIMIYIFIFIVMKKIKYVILHMMSF